MANRTKEFIRQKFIELLSEKPLDKISVKDIAERCGINRHTFYYYYRDIYDLVNDIFVLETEAFIQRASGYVTLEEVYEDVTDFTRTNIKAIHNVYSSEHKDLIRRYFLSVSRFAICEYIEKQAAGLKPKEEDVESIATFFTAAISGITEFWLEEGIYKEEDGRKIKRLFMLLEGGIRNALERSEEM